jgi:hypothetical protein
MHILKRSVKAVRQSFVWAFVSDVQRHPFYYLSWVFLLLVGIFCGAASFKFMGEADVTTLAESINLWLEGYVYGNIGIGERLLSALLTHGRWLLLLVLSGMFRFGMPFAFAVPAIKGYGVGVVVGTLRHAFGFRGVLFSAAALSVQNLLLLPCFAYAGSVAISVICNRPSGYRAGQYGNRLNPSFIFFAAALIIEAVVLPLVIGPLAGRLV